MSRIHIFSRVLFLIVFASALHVSSGQSEANEAYAEWPLPPLSKEERWKRIQDFIKPGSFELFEGKIIKTNLSRAQKKECYRYLEAVKNSSKDDILEPKFVAQSIDDERISNLLGSCGDQLEPYKQYYPDKETWLDSAREYHDYSYYFLNNKNMEFYDLSPFVGDDHWGLLAEGGRPHCKNPSNKLCLDMVGFSGIAKSFDSRMCKEYFIANPGGRYRSLSKTEHGKRKIDHHETYSFSSFVRSDNNVYLIAFSTNASPPGACSHMNRECSTFPNGAAKLHIRRIPKEEQFNQPIPHCVFSPK
jgi:hypothetical protein